VSERRHRVLVAALLALAVVIGLIAVVSTWVNRQALNTNNWTNTSSRLLADPRIQNAVGAYLVNELFSNVDVAGRLREALPTQAQGLAGPASAGLRELANRAAPQVLARPRVQDAWRQANRVAHKQLLTILNGGSSAVSTTNGEVVLNLRPLIDQLATSLGFQEQLASARAKITPTQRTQARGVVQQKIGITLPPDTGKLVILRSAQLKTAQNIAKGIRHLAIISTAVTFALFALALWLARGWRRVTLRSVGWCFVGLGFFALLVRRMGGDWVVDALVKAESVRPAAHDTWSIGTSLLRAIALALVIYGVLIVLAAWLAGPTRPAVAVRRALAPTLRDQPIRVYAGAGLVYVLVLVWGPTPAFRHWIPVLLIAAALVLGIELLRRQAAREFPDAQAGDTMRGLRGWYDARRGQAAPTTQPAAAGPGNGTRLEQLERLATLHDNGALTDEEYSAQKGLLLQG
jgi:hypothetical protein